jgi:hypothetical protein
MSLLVDVKTRLVNLRNDAWQPLFEEVISHFVMQKKKRFQCQIWMSQYQDLVDQECKGT